MNDLINIKINDKQDPIVSGRDLHKFLEVKTAYKDWFPRMVEYGFNEGEDFSSFLSESTGGRPSTDHHIKIDMAKELCMIQRTDKGKQARKFFIEVEKAYNSPEKIMARALRIADETINNLTKKIELDKPKVLFAESVQASEQSILVGQLAKLIRQNGYEIGQNRLFAWLRDNGYLIKRGQNYNQPTQKSMELGLMEVKERSIVNPDGSTRITMTTKITGKGQVYFVNKFVS